MSILDQASEVFREETAELLAELETSLLELEQRPDDADLVARAFRAMHTIKGSGAMFGLDQIATFTHELETTFDLVRNGRLPVTRELVGLALRGRDLIRALLDNPAEGLESERTSLIEELHAFLPGNSPPAGPNPGSSGSVKGSADPAAPDDALGADAATAGPTQPPDPTRPAEPVLKTFRIRFRPHASLLQDGTNPIFLFNELRDLGACEFLAHASAVPPLEEMDPQTCYLSWDVILGTDHDENAIRDVFIFVDDLVDLHVDLIDDGQNDDAGPAYKKLGEILLERGDLTVEQLQSALAAQKRIGDLLQENGSVRPECIQAAALEQKVVREVRAQRVAAAAQTEAASSIRVAADKLDSLVDLVGELVIAQARLAQIAARWGESEISAVSEEIERLSAELRDHTLEIRMVPIGTTFGRFKRLVRDLSGELGKEVELVTEGAETELDKTVIERLGDPLVHLIRNSCDHGIESPETRAAAGKPAVGTVTLAAYHAGANVFIEIRDDGAGLDREAIRTKAIDQGLMTPEAKPADKELFSLIFLPGFSTARKVSNLSGRGVGMDVVKRAIDALRGAVEVESVLGGGTTIRIKLPLTLAIIEGLLVAVGRESYVLPLSLVEECVEVTRRDVERAHGNRLAVVRGELVPYLRLRECFRTSGAPPEVEQIAVTNIEGQRFGFAVDGVVGQLQTVIKNLGNMYRDVEGLSGATILGDGTVALILDAPALMRAAASAEAARPSADHSPAGR